MPRSHPNVDQEGPLRTQVAKATMQVLHSVLADGAFAFREASPMLLILLSVINVEWVGENAHLWEFAHVRHGLSRRFGKRARGLDGHPALRHGGMFPAVISCRRRP